MVKLQYKELFIYDHINSRELSDNYISKPRKNGQLFIIIKIPKNRNNTQNDLDNIIKKCSESFESIKQNNAELLLEEILQELNLFLPEKYKKKKNLFINNLDMIIGIIENNTIHLSNTGNVYALLIHNKKLTPLLSKNIKKSSKIFEDIISGELNNNDILIASTNSLFDYISQEKIKQITKENNPYNSISKIKKILESVPDFVIFNSLIIKKTNNSNEKIHKDERNWKEQNFFTNEKDEVIEDEVIEDEVIEDEVIEDKNKIKEKKYNNKILQTKTKWVIDFKAFKNIKFINKINEIIKFIVKILKNIKKIILYVYNKSKNIITFITSKKYRKEAEEKSINKIKDEIDKKYNWFKLLQKQKRISLIGLFITSLLFIQGLIFLLQNKSEEDYNKNYIEKINIIEENLIKVKSLLIYGDEEGAEDLLLAIRDIIKNININNPSQKEEIKILENNVKKQINEVRHINDVISPLELYDLSSKLINPIQIIQKNENFYVLDENKLYLLKDNIVTELIDFPNGKTLSNWPTENKLILSNLDEYIIFDIDKETIENFSFNKIAGNTSVKDITIYSNNLYVLDNINNQIFKYPEQKIGFANGTPWFENDQDLSKASSFAIDGNIYIINNDGEIEKYNQGKKEKFVYHKLRPLINNNSIIKTFKNSNYLYIIDPNNNRVIILNKDGNIKDQFTSDKFDNLIDLAIDSEEKSIYLLNSNHLYLLAINN